MAIINYKDPVTGDYIPAKTKTIDTLPVGTEVDFDGNEVPSGWTEVPAVKNYINDITNLDNHFTINTATEQQIIKNSDGLVVFQMNLIVASSLSANSTVYAFTIPSAVRPNKYVTLATRSGANVEIYFPSDGQVRLKALSSISANTEINIIGVYYV